jgi:hypothetical protein
VPQVRRERELGVGVVDALPRGERQRGRERIERALGDLVGRAREAVVCQERVAAFEGRTALAPAVGRGEHAPPVLRALLGRHPRPGRHRRALEQPLQRIAEARRSELGEIVGLEAEVVGSDRRQAAWPLA